MRSHRFTFQKSERGNCIIINGYNPNAHTVTLWLGQTHLESIDVINQMISSLVKFKTSLATDIARNKERR